VLPLVLIKRFTICTIPFAKGIRFKYHWNHIASQVSEILRDKKSGIIINISSASAQRPLSRVVGYSASKAAIDNFTKWMSVELAGKYGEGLRVNAIAPGFYWRKNRALLLSPEGDLTARGEKSLITPPWEDLTSRRFRWSTLIFM
jgi:NAD(P)-dependent dehydrogenase (short-subunit alcohol dehydrogenase family)